jgi:hypothetical protein
LCQEQKQDQFHVVSLLCANRTWHGLFFFSYFDFDFGIFTQLLDDSCHVLGDSKFLEESEEQLMVGSVQGLDQVDTGLAA